MTLWRALAVFRVATLAYAVVLTARNFAELRPSVRRLGRDRRDGRLDPRRDHRVRLAAHRGPWPLLVADLAVTAACVLASRWVVGPELLADGMPTLTITWMACPVMAVAIARGRAWGAAAALGDGRLRPGGPRACSTR